VIDVVAEQFCNVGSFLFMLELANRDDDTRSLSGVDWHDCFAHADMSSGDAVSDWASRLLN
jgi:hypothetical protein